MARRLRDLRSRKAALGLPLDDFKARIVQAESERQALKTRMGDLRKRQAYLESLVQALQAHLGRTDETAAAEQRGQILGAAEESS